jgi:hypothetical protein
VFDPAATWLDHLRPAFGEREFFFAAALRRMCQQGGGAGRHRLNLLDDEKPPLACS